MLITKPSLILIESLTILYWERYVFKLFFNDEVLKRAYVQSIEIIGEASNKISPDFKKKYSSTEWIKFSATRNHLVHGYFIVDYEIIWDIVENKIQILEVEMNKIIQNEKTLFDIWF